MDSYSKTQLFQAEVENTRSVKAGFELLKREANRVLAHHGANSGRAKSDLALFARLMALAYSAWSEATLRKIITTPYGFKPRDVKQIHKVWDKHGVAEAWKKTIQLALRRMASGPESSFAPNVKRTLEGQIGTVVGQPAVLRNKVAHGQWSVATNRKQTRVNPDITRDLRQLDYVQVDVQFEIHRRVADVIEDLIESPDRGFKRDYHSRLADLEEYARKTKGWSVQTKEKLLSCKAKRSRTHHASSEGDGNI